MIEDAAQGSRGRPGLENGATILELESAVAAGAGWSAAARVGEEKPTMKGKEEPKGCWGHLGSWAGEDALGKIQGLEIAGSTKVLG